MEEVGGRPVQGAIKEELAGGGKEEVFAPHDLGGAHVVIVGDHGQLVSGYVIMTPNDEVPEVPSGHEYLRTGILIDERDRFAVGHSKAPTQGRFPVSDF
jgi:hypothetical protein